MVKYYEFCKQAERSWHTVVSQRKGQAYFNTLMDMYPDIALKISGTEFDPFYNEENFASFCGYVYAELSRR